MRIFQGMGRWKVGPPGGPCKVAPVFY
jgi:hypothetical protein